MFLKRALSTIAVGAAVAFGPGQAFAAAAPVPFCVNDSAYTQMGLSPTSNCTGNGANGFSVTLLNGSYVEKVLVAPPATPSSPLSFGATIVADFGQYVNNGVAVKGSTLNLFYNVYAVVTATGVLTGANTFQATGATLKLYVDTKNDTSISLPDIDNTTLAFTSDANDLLLGESTFLLNGSGTTSANAGTDGFAVTFTDFLLTAAGESFFIAPRPFYLSVYSDGDINDGTVENVGPGLLTIEGDVSANFFVPEPGTLALVGLSMLGLGIARRRKA